MPSIRIGFASDFTLKNQLVGVGTTTAAYKLNVSETIKGDFEVSGVTTLTSYSGFIPQKQNISAASTIGFTTTGIGTVGITSFISVNEAETGFISLIGEFNTLSEDLIVDDGKILDISTITNIGITTIGTQNVYVPTNTTVSLGTLESLNIASHFSVPNGGINSRQQHPVEGMVRFNDDLNTLEFYNGVEWRQFTVDGSSGRGVWMGGEALGGATETEFNDYVNISTLGNSFSFGDLSVGNRSRLETAGASSTRGVFACGRDVPSTITNIIDYITIASEGKAIDFGDAQQTANIQNGGTKSSSTRGVFSGGTPAELQYIHISTLGNSLSFGDLTVGSGAGGSSASSPTRGVFAQGSAYGQIEAITFASTGKSEQFGDCPTGKSNSAGAGNSVRGVFGGAYLAPGDRKSNAIEYVTLATLGNAIDFGDLTIFRACLRACSTQVRAVFGGGYFTPSTTASGGTADNRIDYVTIASTGNAQDFGDLSSGNIHSRGAALSDSHGGLGGF